MRIPYVSDSQTHSLPSGSHARRRDAAQSPFDARSGFETALRAFLRASGRVVGFGEGDNLVCVRMFARRSGSPPAKAKRGR